MGKNKKKKLNRPVSVKSGDDQSTHVFKHLMSAPLSPQGDTAFLFSPLVPFLSRPPKLVCLEMSATVKECLVMQHINLCSFFLAWAFVWERGFIFASWKDPTHILSLNSSYSIWIYQVGCLCWAERCQCIIPAEHRRFKWFKVCTGWPLDRRSVLDHCWLILQRSCAFVAKIKYLTDG